MGQALISALENAPAFSLAALLDHPSSPAIGSAMAGVVVGADPAQALARCDVLIDFTRPQATLDYLPHCRTRGVNMVIGTTGFSDAELQVLENASAGIAIVLAPNMSMGVNITAKLVDMAARSFGMAADIEVFEAHHKMKVDAPSGTALMLGEVAARARGQSLAAVARHARHGHTGAREAGTIGFSVLRAGDIVGDHSVFFVGEGERIEITHRSSSRANYTAGALRAAQFIREKRSGLYGMPDVLGLNV